MEAGNSPSLHPVGRADQAPYLTDPGRRRFFAPFLGHARTVKEAAALIGCPLNTMLYRVRRMEAVGLLGVVEERPRAGRAVKVYRARHDGYFVPFALTPFADVRERVAFQGRALFGQLTSSYAAALQTEDRLGHAVLLDREGVVWSTDLPPERLGDGRPLVFMDREVTLSPAEAQRTADELCRTFGQAGAETADRPAGAARYLMVVALIPLGAESQS